MKKLLTTIAAVGMCLLANAQGAVYFGNLNETISIGVSRMIRPQGSLTFSIMQMSKSKNFDSFSFRAEDKDGEPVLVTLQPDTIYHLKMDKEYAHQQDYAIKTMDYISLCKVLNDTQATVYINGLSYNGAAFVAVLASLQNLHANPGPQGMPMRRGNIWTQQNGGPMMIRYIPNGRRQQPRFIRFGNKDMEE